ncbi:MAG: 16S rRNA (guanine(966)-N(2))-methyltransferase RsmD [Clostridia bacterium]|nr:16S rRNA (guanine(966)-N(2))-methyltransferase RsmD [Clostridia bacterium]
MLAAGAQAFDIWGKKEDNRKNKRAGLTARHATELRQMRVITGTARGAKLVTLEGTDVRPTTGRVKEAMFSIIQFEIEGRRVLDLFAGSGQLGIEALSRGARSATFVDQSAKAIDVVKQNLLHTKLAEKATVLKSDYAACLAGTQAVYDIAFLDPPYSKGLIDAALPLIAPHMAPNGAVICEAAAKDSLPQEPEGFGHLRVYRYGLTVVGVYRCAER